MKPTSSFSQSRIAAMKNCVGVLVRVKGEGAGPVLPWRTLRPSPFPTPGPTWGTYVVCGCCRAGRTARANALMQIVPNSSSLYTLFYSVIHNSVPSTESVIRLRWKKEYELKGGLYISKPKSHDIVPRVVFYQKYS